jgi:hypothetical protein
MRMLNKLVFDEYIPAANGQAAAFVTSNDLNEELGRSDQIAWQLIADNIAGTGWTTSATMTCRLQTSADGRNWVDKTGSTDAVATFNVAPSTTTLAIAVGSDQGLTPSLGFFRLQIWFSAASIAAHVKVYATARDGRV